MIAPSTSAALLAIDYEDSWRRLHPDSPAPERPNLTMELRAALTPRARPGFTHRDASILRFHRQRSVCSRRNPAPAISNCRPAGQRRHGRGLSSRRSQVGPSGRAQVPSRSSLSDGAALARFHREVRVARQVSHKNVCRVYDIGETDGRHFLSMEYIKGEELSSLLRRIGSLPIDKSIQLARQICAGLNAAHDVGVLHRDLKPANVMIDGDGNARILDFGLAGLSEEFSEHELAAGTHCIHGA